MTMLAEDLKTELVRRRALAKYCRTDAQSYRRALDFAIYRSLTCRADLHDQYADEIEALLTINPR